MQPQSPGGPRCRGPRPRTRRPSTAYSVSVAGRRAVRTRRDACGVDHCRQCRVGQSILLEGKGLSEATTSPRRERAQERFRLTRRRVLGAAPGGRRRRPAGDRGRLRRRLRLRYWALIAVLALTILIATQVAGGIQMDRGPLSIAVGLVWAFAAWTLLSSLWAESAARAWEGAARTILYAAVITVPLALRGRRQALWVGQGIFVGVGAVAVITLIALIANGADLFLAGRLDDPLGYRNATATLFAFAFWPLIGSRVGAWPEHAAACRLLRDGDPLARPGLPHPVARRGDRPRPAGRWSSSRSARIGCAARYSGWRPSAGVAIFASPLLDPYHAFQDGAGRDELRRRRRQHGAARTDLRGRCSSVCSRPCSTTACAGRLPATRRGG